MSIIETHYHQITGTGGGGRVHYYTIHLHVILRGEGGGPLDGDHCDNIGFEERAASKGRLRRDYIKVKMFIISSIASYGSYNNFSPPISMTLSTSLRIIVLH